MTSEVCARVKKLSANITRNCFAFFNSPRVQPTAREMMNKDVENYCSGNSCNSKKCKDLCYKLTPFHRRQAKTFKQNDIAYNTQCCTKIKALIANNIKHKTADVNRRTLNHSICMYTTYYFL